MKFVPFHRLSSLVALHAKAKFHSAAETAWLVWEAGSWTPAQASQEGTAPRDLAAAREDVLTADALVFELTSGPGGSHFVIGRSRTCDVLINDATVSRAHLTLSHATRKWTVALAAGGKEASLDGQPLTASPVALASGQRLVVGAAQLTFLSGPAFEDRLRREAAGTKSKR